MKMGVIVVAVFVALSFGVCFCLKKGKRYNLKNRRSTKGQKRANGNRSGSFSRKAVRNQIRDH